MVAIHLGVTGLATLSLAYFLVRNFRKRYITAFLRICVFIHCTFLLIKRGWAVDGRLPGKQQTDRVLILLAFCFLDDSFSPLRDLKPEARQYLSHNGMPREFRVQIIAITIALGFRVVLFLAKTKMIRLGTKHSMLQMLNLKDLYNSCLPKCYFLLIYYRLIVWVGWNLMIAWNLVTIYKLRDWVDKSSWLKRSEGKNPEDDIQTLGQVAPLIALASIAIAIANGASEAITNQWFSNDPAGETPLTIRPRCDSNDPALITQLSGACPPRNSNAAV